MIEKLKQLKQARKDYEEIKNKTEELMEAYKQTYEYQSYEESHISLTTLKENIELLEREIKEEAVEVSRQTGFVERKFGVVTIKEFTKVNILDQKQAVVWAAANAPSCLTLTKDFDKAAKSLELPFVKVEKEYKAQIATDLSQVE